MKGCTTTGVLLRELFFDTKASKLEHRSCLQDKMLEFVGILLPMYRHNTGGKL